MAGFFSGRLALITGATRGMGAAIAKRYAQEGADLILVARSHENLEKISDLLSPYGSSVTLVPLDVRNFGGIYEMAQACSQRFGKVDIVVGNAGILGKLMPVTHFLPELWHEVWETNFFANWHLLRAFEPLLRKSNAGRALFVTTEAARSVRPFWGAYALSKKALEDMVQLYASENRHPSLKVNLVDPGSVQTDLHAQAFPGIDPLTLPHPDDITDVFVSAASPQMHETGQVLQARASGARFNLARVLR